MKKLSKKVKQSTKRLEFSLKIKCPQGNSNPCRQLERLVS